jgi:Ca2+-binding RTX toxin-like protein
MIGLLGDPAALGVGSAAQRSVIDLARGVYMSRMIVTALSIALLAIPAIGNTASAGTPKCEGKRATIVGTNRGEKIVGTRRADVIVAKGGNDKILGRGGADRICGGGGKDIIIGDGGNDRLRGNGGNDVIRGGGGSDRLFGDTGRDQLYGAGGGDVLKGGSGNDDIWGNVGNDVARGGGGADDIRGEDGNDRLFGDDGVDKLYGGVGDDDLDGGLKNDLCEQGSGGGSIVNCEVADFFPTVDGPGDPVPDNSIIDYLIEIKNDGPDAATYSLKLSYDAVGVTCEPVTDWVGTQRGALLGNGDHKVTVSLSCGPATGGASATVTAETIANATDPNHANDQHSFSVTVAA